MPVIRAIDAVCYSTRQGSDVSRYIAPPYDVLDAAGKDALLREESHNVVAIDLPQVPAKTVGPDAVYEGAAQMYERWLAQRVLERRDQPALFVYQQVYSACVGGVEQEFKRRGLIAGVKLQPFGEKVAGHGAIYPHEETFSGPKEDRMKLMCATQAQLSPIFGLYSDPQSRIGAMLGDVTQSGDPSFFGVTAHDGVRHEVWAVEDASRIDQFVGAMAGLDVFIADGHHRYTTALNYQQRLGDGGAGDRPADYCMFVLVAMQDPGMIVLPTHRVFGAMQGFSLDRLAQVGAGKVKIERIEGGDLSVLEAVLPKAGPHAMGLYVPGQAGAAELAVMTTTDPDPLAASHPDRSAAWRELDVAVLQHVVVGGLLEQHFCETGEKVKWKFPHTLAELETEAQSEGHQLGVVMQATPLDAVRLVSEAGELMPQKSTFFYPKVATGLAIHPLG